MKIEAEHIKKHYGRKTVLNDICFDGISGQCIGILGANGCGKSTLLSVLAGVLKADGGTFSIDSENILGKNTKNGKLVGYVPQGTPLIEELSALDNLRLWYCDSRLDMETELKSGVLAMLGINDFLKVPVNKMSGGMKKRLSIGCAVANDPCVLIMDEPSAALDLVCKERIHNYILDFRSRGGIVIIATHEEQEINLCDKLYIMKNGVLSPLNYDGNVHKLVGMLMNSQSVLNEAF